MSVSVSVLKAQHWCSDVYIQVTTYKTLHALSRDSHRAAEGTLVYVSEKGGELYVRVRNGLRKIQVCVVLVDMWKFDSMRDSSLYLSFINGARTQCQCLLQKIK